MFWFVESIIRRIDLRRSLALSLSFQPDSGSYQSRMHAWFRTRWGRFVSSADAAASSSIAWVSPRGDLDDRWRNVQRRGWWRAVTRGSRVKWLSLSSMVRSKRNSIAEDLRLLFYTSQLELASYCGWRRWRLGQELLPVDEAWTLEEEEKPNA